VAEAFGPWFAVRTRLGSARRGDRSLAEAPNRTLTRPSADLSCLVTVFFMALSLTCYRHPSVSDQDGLGVQAYGKELAYVAVEKR
jgi:hypothetical protein